MKTSRPMFASAASLLLLMSCLAPPAIQAGFFGSSKKPRTVEEAPPYNREELQSAVLSFTDRLIATVGQAAFRFEQALPTPEGRQMAAHRKLFTLSAAVEIAAGPQPGVALLDLLVMVTLNRMVWQEYWQPQVFGMPAQIMVDAFQTLEKDVWAVATSVLTPGQLKELREVIEDWRAAHPEQMAVDYIKFSDFGAIGRKPGLEKMKVAGGLLGPVKEAVKAVDEVRMTSERAMFLFTKMQIIFSFQVEWIYKSLVLQPEMQNLLGDISKFRETAENFSRLAENLPRDIARERKAALKDAAGLVQNERTAIFTALDQRHSALQETLQGVQGIVDGTERSLEILQANTAAVERLMGEAAETAGIFKDLIGSAEQLALAFKGEERADTSREPSKPFDIDNYTAALAELKAAGRQLDQLVQSLATTMDSPFLTNALGAFNAAAEKRINHIFRSLALLILLSAGCLLVILIAYRLLPRDGEKRN